MAKYRVWNKHAKGFTHKEKFRDDWVEIKAGQYILMDYEDAVQFKGQYFPMKRDAMGQEDPMTWKMIFIEPDGDVTTPVITKKFVSHIDGKEFESQAMLDAYLKANFADSVFVDQALDEEIEKQVVLKKKPGPKAKEKTA